MSRVKLLLLGVLTVCALGATASATPALASCTGSTNWVYCNGSGTELPSGTAFLGLGGLALLAGTAGGAEIKFHCPDVHLSGTLQTLGMSTGSLKFLGCTVVKPTSCKLSAADEKEIEAKFLGQLTGGLSATLTGAGANELFATLHVEEKSGCPSGVAKNYEVTGSQLVEIPKGDESVVTQEIIAKKSGSHLNLGGATASFSGTSTSMLQSGETWLNMFGV